MGAAEALGGLVEYERGGSFGIAEHVTIPQPYHPPTLSFEIGSALGIVIHLIVMVTAIYLNRQLGFAICEINDVQIIDR